MFSKLLKTLQILTLWGLSAIPSSGCSSDNDREDDCDSKDVDSSTASKSDTGLDTKPTGQGDQPCGKGPATEGEPGDDLIRVRPMNDVKEDVKNLQWAVDSVEAGGTVELCEGTFSLGDGVSEPKNTIKITKGIYVIGIKESSEWKTIIQGASDDLDKAKAASDRGFFRISNQKDPNPNIFENLWMRGWTAEAVFIDAVQGFTIKNCRISNPVVDQASIGLHFIHAIYTSGKNTKGDFSAENNLVELGNYPGILPDDEQLLGVFFSAHDNVRVVGNEITGLDEAIEILGNNSTDPSQIVVEGNTINISFELEDRWPGKNAILVGGNLNTSQVQIEDNEMVVQGPGTVIGVSGENLSIRNNQVKLKEWNGLKPISAFTIGLGRGEATGIKTGPSLVNSVIEDNDFSGSVEGPAVNLADVPEFPNLSHDNVIKLGDSIANLGAETTIYIAPGAYDNTFEGKTGNVQDDSPEGKNTY